MTLMWEALAVDGRTDDLVAWACALGVGDVYRSEDRVVVIVDGVDALPRPPAGTCVREPREWTFERVARS